MKYFIGIILFIYGVSEAALAQENLLTHKMVFVEGGTFQMGNNAGEYSEKPFHSVILSSFNIGKYEVTQAQWRELMGNHLTYNSDCDNCPINFVSLNDVQEYIQKLNSQTGKKYRLPTEAEWEYAAKGGKLSKGYKYSGSNDITEVAWYRDNSSDLTHIVGSKNGNELGIHDMSGNVLEWCSDWYGNYSDSWETNPTGSSSGESCVIRGGSWNSNAYRCRTSNRHSSDPEYRRGDFGFRLVLPAVN